MLEQLSKTNTKEYQSYLALLNYVGVTLNNVNELSKKLNALKTLNPNTKEYKTLFGNKCISPKKLILTLTDYFNHP